MDTLRERLEQGNTARRVRGGPFPLWAPFPYRFCSPTRRSSLGDFFPCSIRSPRRSVGCKKPPPFPLWVLFPYSTQSHRGFLLCWKPPPFPYSTRSLGGFFPLLNPILVDHLVMPWRVTDPSRRWIP